MFGQVVTLLIERTSLIKTAKIDQITKKITLCFGADARGSTFAAMMQQELLDRLETELRDLLDIVRTRLGDKPLEALQIRRDLQAWNALECIAHLNIFLEMYLPRLERAIHLSKARRWTPGQNVRYTMTGRRVIKNANLANFKPRKTPKRYDFFQKPMGKEVLKTFIINSERLLRNLQAARETDLNKAKIGWGPSGFFKLTLGNLFEWLVMHGQRHVLQAQNAIGQ